MIKIIAFDLVGVLVSEKDIELTEVEDKLERMFGPNLNDADYLIAGRNLIEKDSLLLRTTEEMIGKLYEVKDKDLFKKIKEQYKYVKIIIATNHVSFVRNFIGEAFGVDYLDDIIISSEIHKIKPNKDFYEHILTKYEIKPDEMLFIDDNLDNVNSAKDLSIHAIKINKDANVFDEIMQYIEDYDLDFPEFNI